MQKTDSLNKQGIDWNNVIQHGKSYSFIRLLAYETGEDVFFNIFRYCLDNYKGVNVTPEMFQNACEKISNRNLDTIFHQWLYTNDFLEYRVDTIINDQRDSICHAEIIIDKTGKAEISEFKIAIRLNNGETINRTINGKAKQVVIQQDFNSPVKEVILDPEFKFPLVNKIPDLMKNIRR